MWSDSWWQFDLVVRIADDVSPGQVLINTVEAHGDSPDDVEFNTDNNLFELPLRIQSYTVYLPLVLRKY